MGESRVPCPFCERPVGGVHADECSRSRVVQARGRRLSDILRQMCRQNFIWITTVLRTGPELTPPRKARYNLVPTANGMPKAEPVLYNVRAGGTRRAGERAEKHPQGTVVQALIEMIKSALADEEADDAPTES